MNPDQIYQIPKEAYYLIGILVVSNISTIISYFKNQTDRAVEIAVIKEQIKTMNSVLAVHDDDIKAAHDKIREIKVG